MDNKIMHAHSHQTHHKTSLSLESDIDFRGLFYSLWGDRFFILITMIIVTAAALFYTFYKPYQYESNIIIQVQGKSLGGMGIFQQFGSGGQGGSATATQSALIKSRVILDPVVSQLNLGIHVHPHYFPVIGQLWGSNKTVVMNLLTMPSALLSQTLKLKIIDQTHFRLTDTQGNFLAQGEVGKIIVNQNQGISIQVKEIHAKPGDEFDVARYSNISMVNQIIPRLRVQTLGEAGDQTDMLSVSFKDVDPIRLVKILNTIAQVVEMKDIERKAKESEKMLKVLELQLPSLKDSLEKAESRLNQYRAVSGKLDIKLETHALMTQLIEVEKEITKTTLTKIASLQNYTDKHPFIIELNDKIKHLNEEKISLENQLKKIPASDQAMGVLVRDVTVKNALYLKLLSKIQELRASKAGTIGDVRILATALPPEAPLSKQTSVVFFASMLLGLIIGCLMVLGKKAFRRHIEDPHWVEQNFNLINLAIVPYSKQQAKNIHAFKTKLHKSIEILAEKYPHDLSLEALRSLRTSLQFILMGATNHMVNITGISPSIGKSFISVNFACILADAGKKVLLIDGDMRKGHLHDYFQSSRSQGLSEILSGNITFEDAFKTTSFKTLHFLSCGHYPPNPAELLAHDNFKKLIDSVASQFDVIIIDTPPILAATDSTIIGSLTSTNLLVIGSNTHQTEELTLALNRLNHGGVKIQGTIFNYLKEETVKYGNYQYKYTAADMVE